MKVKWFNEVLQRDVYNMYACICMIICICIWQYVYVGDMYSSSKCVWIMKMKSEMKMEMKSKCGVCNVDVECGVHMLENSENPQVKKATSIKKGHKYILLNILWL